MTTNRFAESETVIKALVERIENSNETPGQLLQDFYNTIDSIDFFMDLNPTVSKCYFKLLNRLSDDEIKQSVEKVSETNSSVLLFDDKGIRELIKKHPALTKWLYGKLKKSMTESKNYDYLYIKQIAGIVIASMGNTTHKLFKDLANVSDKFKLVLIYAGLNFIYKNKTNLRNNILSFLESVIDTKNKEHVIEAYKLMNKIFAYDKSVAETFIKIIRKTLNTDTENNLLTKQIVLLLSEICEIPEYTNEAKELLLRAQKTKNIDLQTVRIAARKLKQTELLRSRIKIGQRINSEKDNNWKFVDTIPVDTPVVVVLGGDGTTTPKAANGYAKKILRKLENENMPDVNVYSVVYDFGDSVMGCRPLDARKIQMKKFGRNIALDDVYTQENINPNYINELFEIAIRPRLEKNGEKIPVQVAMQNIRRINFVAHCHGAYTFQKLEEMMQKTMTDLGYTSVEKKQIQKQLLCIAHAPHCPLENAKSTVINFASAKDFSIEHYNIFQQILHKLDKRHKLSFSFFSEKCGNVFIAPQIFDMWFQRNVAGIDTNILEHDFTDYDDDYDLLTIEGATIKKISGNVLVNAVRNSASNSPIPTVKELACENNKDLSDIFKILEKNGQKVYCEILKKARSR